MMVFVSSLLANICFKTNVSLLCETKEFLSIPLDISGIPIIFSFLPLTY